MKRSAFSLVEVMIALAILTILLTLAVRGLGYLGKSSKVAFDELSQTQDVLLFLEDVRMELEAMVMNPLPPDQLHEGNSYIRSQPNHTSIQFVTERQDATGRQRYLVYYEAARPAGTAPDGPLTLKKSTWKFTGPPGRGTWIEHFPTFPPDWIGPLVKTEEQKFKELNVLDLRFTDHWSFMPEGWIYFRVNFIVGTPNGERQMPYTTLVGVPTPAHPWDLAGCPCLFAPDYNPADPKSCEKCMAGRIPFHPPGAPLALPDPGLGGGPAGPPPGGSEGGRRGGGGSEGG